MNLPGKQKDIKDFSYEELEDYLKSSSEQSFRAAQIFDWLYKKGAEDFDAMTNLPVALREKLKSDFLTGKRCFAFSFSIISFGVSRTSKMRSAAASAC